MKNLKYVFILTCLLCIPASASAYTPTDAELRSSIYDYIGTQSQRQQYQDIIDSGNRAYSREFDTYYQSIDRLEKEYELSLKELEMKQDAEKRDAAWQKEKAVLDKELELIIKENELKKREDAINKPASSGINWDQAMKEANEAVEKSRKLETPENKNVVPSKRVKEKGIFDDYSESTGGTEIDSLLSSFKSTQPEATVVPEPPKNQTRFEHFKQASASTIKKVASWLNPVSWFKK